MEAPAPCSSAATQTLCAGQSNRNATAAREEISAELFEPLEFPWEDEKASPSFLLNRARSLLDKDTALGNRSATRTRSPRDRSAIARCRYQTHVR